MITPLDASADVTSTAQSSQPHDEHLITKSVLKRRRSHSSDEKDIFQPFQISSDTTSSLTAYPLFLFPRTNLPLTYIDYANPYVDKHALPRTFTANILCLETLFENVTVNLTPNILVIRLSPLDGLYVVERVSKYVYSLCKLAPWASLERLQCLSRKPQLNIYAQQGSLLSEKCGGKDWWAIAAVENPAVLRCLENANIIRELPQNDGQQDKTSETHGPAPSELIGNGVAQIGDEPPISGNNDEIDVVENTYDVVLDQYLDALYMSKASLAYFVKGPLSRARTTLKSADDDQTARQPFELAEFLKGLIYTEVVLDKKYKASIPATIIASLKTETTPKLKRRKRVKAFRPGKDGLFPTESDIVQKWWNTEELQGSHHSLGDNPDAFVRNKLSSLRFRENLLQLILLLEVQALEMLPNGKRQETAQNEENQMEPPDLLKPASKRRKSLDLKSLTDSLVDRLTIWQSISKNDSGDDSPQVRSTSETGSESGQKKVVAQDDELKDFHSQVIVPFFAARIPRIVNDLAQRFGIIHKQSPSRPRPTRSRSKNEKTQPDGRTRRANKDKPGTDLCRVSSISQRASTLDPPSLVRSATDPTLLSLKNERNSTLSSNSRMHGDKRALSRSNSISQARRLSQREVDLGAISKFKDSKSKKKASTESELKDAIAALKKPNRGLVAKEYFDSAQAVRLPAQNHSSRHQSLNFKGGNKSIEVTATPRRVTKTKNIITTTPRLSSGAAEYIDDPNISLASIVPSSTIKPEAVDGMVRSHDLGADSEGDFINVNQTPSRGLRKQRTVTMVLESSPNDPQEASIVPASHVRPKPTFPTFLSLPAAEKKARLSPLQYRSIFSTPVKEKMRSDNLVQGSHDGRMEDISSLRSANPAAASISAPQKSIYETLGWDDSDIDELT